MVGAAASTDVPVHLLWSEGAAGNQLVHLSMEYSSDALSPTQRSEGPTKGEAVGNATP